MTQERTTRILPADFQLSILEEAYRLRRSALAQSKSHELDERTSMWIIREDAWRDLAASRDCFQHIDVRQNGSCRLMGLPVRRTIYDDDDTPMIQLVMEPVLLARR